MKIRFSQPKFLVFVAAASVGFACGKKDEDEDTSSNALAAVESLDQLNVSGALNIEMPDAYATKTASLRLIAGKRSHEACRMGQTMEEVKDRIDTVRNFFCHLEVEAAKIKFGTRYKITQNGEEFGRVWADNSKAADGRIALYMCENGALKEKIEVTGFDEAREAVKGSIQQKGSEDTQSWASSVVFDILFSDENLRVVDAQDLYEDSATSGSFARHVNMSIYTEGAGVSEMALASQGTWNGSDFQDRGFGRHDGDYGHAKFASQGSNNGNVYDWSHDSFFDAEGLVVSSSASAAFTSGGTLDVTADDMPDFLADSFSPTEPEGWDCDVDETIELDPESAGHQACETEWTEPADCWGADFEQGEE